MRRSFALRDCIYDVKSLWRDLCKGIAVTLFFAWFFYRSVWAVAPMSLVGLLYVWWAQRQKRHQGGLELLAQFKECILSVSASLRAGYAVENAFMESISDMRMMFGEGSRIERALISMRQGLGNNMLLEELLYELGQKSGAAQIQEFADVFVIAKRNGGSIPEMIDASSHIIQGRLDLIAEMETMLASKRLEQRVMNVMPFLIVLYLDRSNPGYFDMFYHNLTGVCLMTGCLAVYLGAFALAEWIFAGIFGEEE